MVLYTQRDWTKLRLKARVMEVASMVTVRPALALAMTGKRKKEQRAIYLSMSRRSTFFWLESWQVVKRRQQHERLWPRLTKNELLDERAWQRYIQANLAVPAWFSRPGLQPRIWARWQALSGGFGQLTAYTHSVHPLRSFKQLLNDYRHTWSMEVLMKHLVNNTYVIFTTPIVTDLWAYQQQLTTPDAIKQANRRSYREMLFGFTTGRCGFKKSQKRSSVALELVMKMTIWAIKRTAGSVLRIKLRYHRKTKQIFRYWKHFARLSVGKSKVAVHRLYDATPHSWGQGVRPPLRGRKRYRYHPYTYRRFKQLAERHDRFRGAKGLEYWERSKGSRRDTSTVAAPVTYAGVRTVQAWQAKQPQPISTNRAVVILNPSSKQKGMKNQVGPVGFQAGTKKVSKNLAKAAVKPKLSTDTLLTHRKVY